MNYKQKKITRQAKKEFKEYHDNLYNEFFEKANKNFIKVRKGKSFAEYFDRLKTYPYFKRKVSERSRQAAK